MDNPLCTLPEGVQETLSTWDLLRSLGFSADDLYVGYQDGGALIQVQAQGLVFTVCAACPGFTRETFFEAWPIWCRRWVDATVAQRRQIVQQSEVRAHAVALISALLDKGFSLPCVDWKKALDGWAGPTAEA